MLREEECVILQVPTLRYLNFVFNYNIILHYKDNTTCQLAMPIILPVGEGVHVPPFLQ